MSITSDYYKNTHTHTHTCTHAHVHTQTQKVWHMSKSSIHLHIDLLLGLTIFGLESAKKTRLQSQKKAAASRLLQRSISSASYWITAKTTYESTHLHFIINVRFPYQWYNKTKTKAKKTRALTPVSIYDCCIGVRCFVFPAGAVPRLNTSSNDIFFVLTQKKPT